MQPAKGPAILQGIASYTLETWGEAQCARYLDHLEELHIGEPDD